jgi:hypothetical protein
MHRAFGGITAQSARRASWPIQRCRPVGENAHGRLRRKIRGHDEERPSGVILASMQRGQLRSGSLKSGIGTAMRPKTSGFVGFISTMSNLSTTKPEV